MRILCAILMWFSSLGAFAQGADANQAANEIRNLPWQRGPGAGAIADKATIKLGTQDAFLGEQGTSRLLVLMGNPPRSGHYALVPTTDESWIGVFAFDSSGYVKDDEKIDADALMAQMKEGDAADRDERKRLGLPELRLLGWYVPPHYDPQTKRLEWGTKLQDGQGNILVNYTARMLGRTGVMSAILISDPTKLDADRRSFDRRLAAFQFNSGETYSEFRQGDRVAEYGLAALIAGGAAAVATKKGLWAVIGGFIAAFWKFILGIGIAALAGLRSIFRKKQ